MNGDQVAVIWDISETNTDGERDEKCTSKAADPSVYWIHGMLVEMILDC